MCCSFHHSCVLLTTCCQSYTGFIANLPHFHSAVVALNLLLNTVPQYLSELTLFYTCLPHPGEHCSSVCVWTHLVLHLLTPSKWTLFLSIWTCPVLHPLAPSRFCCSSGHQLPALSAVRHFTRNTGVPPLSNPLLLLCVWSNLPQCFDSDSLSASFTWSWWWLKTGVFFCQSPRSELISTSLLSYPHYFPRLWPAICIGSFLLRVYFQLFPVVFFDWFVVLLVNLICMWWRFVVLRNGTRLIHLYLKGGGAGSIFARSDSPLF